MAKYSVTFEINVIVDEPEINVGRLGDIVYDELGKNRLTDARWNDIVCDAVSQIEDIGNNVTEIVKISDDDYDDDYDDEDEDEEDED